MLMTLIPLTLRCDRCGAELDDPGEDGTTPPSGQMRWLTHLAQRDGWQVASDTGSDWCGDCTGFTAPEPDPDTPADADRLGFIVWYDTGADADYHIYATLGEAVDVAADWRTAPGLVGETVHISRQHLAADVWDGIQRSWWDVNDGARTLYTWRAGA
jgi:hypothetical protein